MNNSYAKIDNAIRKALADSKKRFVIYPFGEDGMLAKDILKKRYNLNNFEISQGKGSG